MPQNEYISEIQVNVFAPIKKQKESGYKDVGNFREQHINPLIAEKKLEMTIPDQPNNRNQKYRNISQKFYIKGKRK